MKYSSLLQGPSSGQTHSLAELQIPVRSLNNSYQEADYQEARKTECSLQSIQIASFFSKWNLAPGYKRKTGVSQRVG